MTVELHGESPLPAYAETLAQHSYPNHVVLNEVPFLAQVNMRVDPKSPAAERIGTALGVMLPTEPDEVVRAGEISVLWLGPDEWLVLGAEGTAQDTQNRLNSALDGEHGAVTDVSANRTVLSVTGAKARELLNKGCALDLHPRSFGVDRCAQTLLARAGVILVCRDETKPSFWVLVRSSFTRYLADWLVDAAAEYGGGAG